MGNYVETSAKTSTGLDNCFDTCIREAIHGKTTFGDSPFKKNQLVWATYKKVTHAAQVQSYTDMYIKVHYVNKPFTFMNSGPIYYRENIRPFTWMEEIDYLFPDVDDRWFTPMILQELLAFLPKREYRDDHRRP